MKHKSDCAVHNAPALPKGDCDCGAIPHLRLSPEALASIIDREYDAEPWECARAAVLEAETVIIRNVLAFLDTRCSHGKLYRKCASCLEEVNNESIN